jgi:hypothetical protein
MGSKSTGTSSPTRARLRMSDGAGETNRTLDTQLGKAPQPGLKAKGEIAARPLISGSKGANSLDGAMHKQRNKEIGQAATRRAARTRSPRDLGRTAAADERARSRLERGQLRSPIKAQCANGRPSGWKGSLCWFPSFRIGRSSLRCHRH